MMINEALFVNYYLHNLLIKHYFLSSFQFDSSEFDSSNLIFLSQNVQIDKLAYFEIERLYNLLMYSYMTSEENSQTDR